jgi:hypothetical protein
MGFAFAGLTASAVRLGLPAFGGAEFFHAFHNISTNNLAWFGEGYGCPAGGAGYVEDPVVFAITGLTGLAVTQGIAPERCF